MLKDLKIDRNKSRDTGMAAVLILLILGWRLENDLYFYIAIPVLIINMVVPDVYKYLAYLWFGLAIVLGTVISKILLILVFLIAVLPIAVLRRLIGKDSLQIKKWRKGSESVFQTRDHKFVAGDIDKPY